MSCSAPSPLINVIWTTWPSAADRAADTDEDHASLGNPRSEGVANIWNVADRAALRRRCGSGRCSGRGRSGGRSCRAGRKVCDHIPALVLGLESGEGHLVTGHGLLRVEKILVEGGKIPGEPGSSERR